MSYFCKEKKEEIPKESKFKVLDKVKIIRGFYRGQTGTLKFCSSPSNDYSYRYTLIFDNLIYEGKDCNMSFFQEYELELVK